MRSRYLAALVALALPAAAPAAQVCTGNINLTTQTQADAFACSEVRGNINILFSDISDLGGLSELTSVDGFLRILFNTQLTNVDGLAALTSVGGFLQISTNAQLANVDGLSALTEVGGYLKISDNAQLANVNGLAALASVDDYLEISENAQLANVDGLSALTEVGSYIQIFTNAQLANVDGLSALTEVVDFLTISDNAQLANVDGLSALTSVGDYLLITSNPQLANVDGLRNLASVPGAGSTFGLGVVSNAVLARCAVGLGPILTADAADDSVIGAQRNSITSNGGALAGGMADSDCNSEQSILDAYDEILNPPPVATLPLTATSLTAPGGDLVLPARRGQVRVTASATFTGETGQRFTIFIRLDGPDGSSRIAKRGEIKLAPGGTASQSIKFGTTAADPAGAYTVTLLAAEGSVATADGAEVIATLPATKLGGGALRASEPLAAFPNPATNAATLRFAVAEAGEAVLVIYDALGREVARPVDGVASGLVEASVDVRALPAGVYVARLSASGRVETVRFSVIR